jgi:type IV pilus assembly protein PilE
MRKSTGFTLVELMVVIAVIAIIAAIAIPSFAEQVRKSRRSDAFNGLGELQLRQERWQAEHPAYATSAQLGAMPASSHYTFTNATPAGNCADGTTPCTNANCYALTANTQGAQTADDGKCATLTLASRCGQITRTSTPSGGSCWSQ